jgi:hypothetical protein
MQDPTPFAQDPTPFAQDPTPFALILVGARPLIPIPKAQGTEPE